MGSLGDELLVFLSNHPGNYRNLRERMLQRAAGTFDSAQPLRKKVGETSDGCTRVTLSRLKKNGLIENKRDNGLWQITSLGRERLAKFGLLKKTIKKKKQKTNRKVIIAFDIPETHKRSRNWLRVELISLEFKMMQKSVWLGPAPLSKEFIESLRVAKILPYLKFFEVKEEEII